MNSTTLMSRHRSKATGALTSPHIDSYSWLVVTNCLSGLIFETVAFLL